MEMGNENSLNPRCKKCLDDIVAEMKRIYTYYKILDNHWLGFDEIALYRAKSTIKRRYLWFGYYVAFVEVVFAIYVRDFI